MVQSVTNLSPQAGFGFESLIRFGASAAKGAGAASRLVVRPDSSSSADSSSAKSAQSSAKSEQSSAVRELTPEEQRIVSELAQTDRKVRAHEQAHISVGADLVQGGPTFVYATGPDKKRYAISGEVSIDTSPARTPEETIPKAQHIRATALAPAEPSPQDQRVASLASSMEMNARIEVAIQQREQAAESLKGADVASETASESAEGVASEAASSEGAGFYRGVASGNTRSASVGGVFDSFA